MREGVSGLIGCCKRSGLRYVVVALVGSLGFTSGCDRPATLSKPVIKWRTHVQGALRVEGNRLVDSSGHAVLLRGAQIAGLNMVRPTHGEEMAVKHLNRRTFMVMSRGWHMNVVRLPLSDFIWKRWKANYLNLVARVVREANAAGLTVVLDLHEDRKAGAPAEPPGILLPLPESRPFWMQVARRFRDNPHIFFDVYNEPKSNELGGPRASTAWTVWLHGGTIAGYRYLGMQDLVDAIRSAGARQVIAVEGLRGGTTLAGIEGHVVRGRDIIYSVHPYFAAYQTTAEWDQNFGFLTNRFPIYAGEWGLLPNGQLSNCRAIPSNRATAEIDSLLFYFGEHAISWTAFAFMVPRLIQNYKTYTPTTLEIPWRCGDWTNHRAGMGQIVKAYLQHS